MANAYVQVMLSGLLLGSLYGLAGTGLNLIMAATGQVHLAYGHLWAGAGLAAAALINAGFLPLVPAVAIVALVWAAGAWAIHPGGLWNRRLEGPDHASFFLVTLGVALIIEDLGRHLIPLPVSALALAPRPLHLGGLVVPPARVATFGLLVVLSLVLAAFLRFNRWGLALRAWDQGRGPLWAVGVDPSGLGRRLMAVCVGLAGLAGGMLCLGHTVAIQDGMALTMRSLCVAAAGNASRPSPLPVMVAGLGLGMAEALIGAAFGTQWTALVPVALVILILHVRRIDCPWPQLS